MFGNNNLTRVGSWQCSVIYKIIRYNVILILSWGRFNRLHLYKLFNVKLENGTLDIFWNTLYDKDCFPFLLSIQWSFCQILIINPAEDKLPLEQEQLRRLGAYKPFLTSLNHQSSKESRIIHEIAIIQERYELMNSIPAAGVSYPELCYVSLLSLLRRQKILSKY